MTEKSDHRVRIWIIVLALLLVISVTWQWEIGAQLRQLVHWTKEQGEAGAVLFVLLYIVSTVLLFPGSLLSLAAGFVYGLWMGTLLVLLAATLAATISFLLGRILLRGWVVKKIRNQPQYLALDDSIYQQGWKITLLTRLSPFFPFNLISYGLGLTKIDAGDYITATLVGTVPATIMYVYLGSVAKAIAGSVPTEDSYPPEVGPLEWIIYGIGFLLTVAITIYLSKLARRGLGLEGKSGGLR